MSNEQALGSQFGSILQYQRRGGGTPVSRFRGGYPSRFHLCTHAVEHQNQAVDLIQQTNSLLFTLRVNSPLEIHLTGPLPFLYNIFGTIYF